MNLREIKNFYKKSISICSISVQPTECLRNRHILNLLIFFQYEHNHYSLLPIHQKHIFRNLLSNNVNLDSQTNLNLLIENSLSKLYSVNIFD